MEALITADCHLTDNPRDEYRWDLFPWLRKKAKALKVKRVIILGDLTDAKDRHSEVLTNRIADEVASLAEAVEEVIFNPGNHDGIREGHPFFRFVRYIPNVFCIEKPTTLNDEASLFLPNTRDYKTAWQGIDFSTYRYIFCHQTFDGCKTENGTKLAGIPPSVFGETEARIYSGDIHVPQILTKNPHLEYVGAPYRIRFGDRFVPRILHIGETKNGGHQQQDLDLPTLMKFLIEVAGDDPQKLFLKELKRLDVREGDQVKLRVFLPRTDCPEWPTLRADLIEIARAKSIDLFGPEMHMIRAAQEAPGSAERIEGKKARALSPQAMLARYGAQEKLSPELIAAGASFLTE